MTGAELERIVKRHEMRRLEFKESFGVECIETACAFANAEGGLIVIGVDDHGERVKKPLRFEALRDYENRITTATEPSVAIESEKFDFGGGEVVVLKVSENPLKPVAYKGRCYLRKGSVNHQMTPAEIAECHLKSTGGSPDAVFVPGAVRDELDVEAVRDYMRIAVDRKRRDFRLDEDPWRILRKLGLVKSDEEITRAAYLLFAKNPQERFSQATVHCGLIRGGAMMLDSRVIGGRLSSQIDETLAFVSRNIKVRFEVTAKAERNEYWDYPLEAIRETVANAVCHRDYGIANDIQLKIAEDRLRVWSPGALPFDAPMDVIMNPDHCSHPRNKLIAQLFYDMGIIERYGSGIERIREECAKGGYAQPDWKEVEGGFATIYRVREGGAINGAVGGAINGGEKLDGVLADVYRLILANPGVKTDSIIGSLKIGSSTVDRAVKRLKGMNLVQYKGSRKTGGYFAAEVRSKGEM